MKKGQVDYAVRRALALFDQWNDVTGFVPVGTGYHGEIESIIEDAVHCGIQVALYGDIKSNADGCIIRERRPADDTKVTS
jgi:hypothetical protein